MPPTTPPPTASAGATASADAPAIELAEIPLSSLLPGAPLRARFEMIHRPDWLDLGIDRWLALLDPHGGWPTAVLGAFAGPERSANDLLGTIVGVRAPTPIDRFDDLLERQSPDGARGADRPSGGRWHFIAVTVDPAQRGGGLVSPLLAAALDFVVAQPGDAEACTLSPVVGLGDALAAMGVTPRTGDAGTRAAIWHVLRHLAEPKGWPRPPIFRLHPRHGAYVERVLFDSRRDEVRSAGVTLRFRYQLDANERAATQARIQAWVDARAAQAAGAAAGPLERSVWLAAPGDDDPADAALFAELGGSAASAT